MKEPISEQNLRNTVALLALTVFMLFALIGCRVIFPDQSIPSEPTIWIVSEILEDHKIKNKLVAYKIKPVNQGGINARTVWILDYSGKYSIGDLVDFQEINK